MLTAWVDTGQTHVVAQVVCAVLISFGIFIAILYATGSSAEHEDANPEPMGRFAKQRAVRRN